jgi:hypothetical protein
MIDTNTITYTVNDDALDVLHEKLDQIYALMITNVGNNGAHCWNADVADGYFSACADLVESAKASLKVAVVRD